MILNIALLLVVFGATKKAKNPYAGALLLGLIKGAVYAVFSRNIFSSVIMGCVFAGLAAAFIYFLKRLDRYEAAERGEVPTYGSPDSEKMKFKWEYIPLSALLMLIVGGEILLM